MRADRLVATLLLMQARGRVTATEVARELETSVATARRDLEALSAAGIPVYPQPGRGGGWQLLGGARTDLSGLSAVEAQALFLLVGPAASVSPDAKAALRKLVRALPETFREDAQAAASAVVIDPSRWGAPETDASSVLRQLSGAVVSRLQVQIDYASWGREPARRLVDPWGLADKNGTWYLIAGTDAGERTYRVDRITSVEVTDAAAHRPADFDLSAAWDRIVAEVEQVRSRATASVLVTAEHLPYLRTRFGRSCVVGETLADGRVGAEVSAQTPWVVAMHLAGFGGVVEVLSPDAVRDELATIGAALVARYGNHAP